MTAVRVERDGQVVELVLDYPPVNAVSRKLVDDWASCLAEIDDTHRCVLVRSAVPGIFMAGGDLDFLAGGALDELVEYVADLQRGFAALSELPMPVVSVVDGHCLGGGLELALASDLVLATERATFALPEVRLGILPAAGGLHRLVRRVGEGRARSLLLTGDRVDAHRGELLGIVDRLLTGPDPLTEARSFTARLAGLPRSSVAAIKRLTGGVLDRPVAAGLAEERTEWRAARGTAETQAALDAGLAGVNRKA